MVTDAATSTRLVKQIAKAVALAAKRHVQQAEGDYSPDANLARFPGFEPSWPGRPTAASPTSTGAGGATGTGEGRGAPPRFAGGKVTVEILLERYAAFNDPFIRPSTMRPYRPSIAKLSTFMGGRDVRTLASGDFAAWADHRRDVDGIAPRTFNANDLVAALSLFAFAATHESDRSADDRKVALRPDNPVRGVRLKLPAGQATREKKFRIAGWFAWTSAAARKLRVAADSIPALTPGVARLGGRSPPFASP